VRDYIAVHPERSLILPVLAHEIRPCVVLKGLLKGWVWISFDFVAITVYIHVPSCFLPAISSQ
jgi:hypothetical protein